MSVATDLLVEEHRIIQHMLATLNKAADCLEKNETVPSRVFLMGADFIANFADHCHHDKEENILFKLMVKRGMSDQVGPIRVMLLEHEQGRRLRAALAEAAEHLNSGNAAAKEDVIKSIRNYSQLLTQHIQKENDILYPKGNRLFSSNDQEYLTREFERIEKEEIGEGVHEKYHHMIEEIEGSLRKNNNHPH